MQEERAEVFDCFWRNLSGLDGVHFTHSKMGQAAAVGDAIYRGMDKANAGVTPKAEKPGARGTLAEKSSTRERRTESGGTLNFLLVGISSLQVPDPACQAAQGHIRVILSLWRWCAFHAHR